MATYGPYSPVRQVDDWYFVSGQVGVDHDSRTAPKDVAAQTTQALKNLTYQLAQYELTMNYVVKTTIYLKHMSDFAAVNAIYATYFDDPKPARSCVAVTALPDVGKGTEILVEIEATAHKAAQDVAVP